MHQVGFGQIGGSFAWAVVVAKLTVFETRQQSALSGSGRGSLVRFCPSQVNMYDNPAHE